MDVLGYEERGEDRGEGTILRLSYIEARFASNFARGLPLTQPSPRRGEG